MVRSENIVIPKNKKRTIFKEINSQHTKIIIEERARLNYIIVCLGGGSVETEIEVILKGEGSQVTLRGIVFVYKENKVSLKISIHHTTGKTKADVLIKSVLYKKAAFNCRGLVKVEKGACKTSSQFSNHTLIIGDKAHAISSPLMEIDTDDVVAGHAVTIGRLDKEQLFYLMSRGLKREEAEKLMVQGFVGEVVEYMEDLHVKDKLMQNLKSVKY